MVRKRSGRRNENRKDKANSSVVQLSNIINSPKEYRDRIRDVAARDLLKLGKKHGTRGNSETNSSICRMCKSILIPGLNVKIRIRDKSVISTCKRCANNKKRGPTFHMELNDND